MKVVFMGFLSPDGVRETREGFTIGKVYEAERREFPVGSYRWVVTDDDGSPRVRPDADFEPAPIRRAWARFPSLQSVFG